MCAHKWFRFSLYRAADMSGGRSRGRQNAWFWLQHCILVLPPSPERRLQRTVLGRGGHQGHLASMRAAHDVGSFSRSASTSWRGGGNYRKETKLGERSRGIKRGRWRGKHGNHSRDTLPPSTVAYQNPIWGNFVFFFWDISLYIKLKYYPPPPQTTW